MTRAINSQAVVASLHNLRDEVEEVLALAKVEPGPEVVAEVFDLGEEIIRFAEELAYASTATELLQHLAGQLACAATEFAERYGTRPVQRGDFAVPTRVPTYCFGRRFLDILTPDDLPV